ncbi:hypothetical protein AB0F42_26300 [Streptomyces buecherae]|uniref:hypothetical protein n=1 Tax=Streptomyces buecherae TaxID=2763006 RepID=UPI0033D83671
MKSLGEVGVNGTARRRGGRERARQGRAGAHGEVVAFGGRHLFSASAAAGMRGMPVGEGVAEVGEVGADDVLVLVSQVTQAPSCVGIGGLAEFVRELTGGSEHLLQRGEEAVVGGGQLAQGVGSLVRAGGVAKTLGEAGHGRVHRQASGRAGAGVEVLAAADVVSGPP